MGRVGGGGGVARSGAAGRTREERSWERKEALRSGIRIEEVRRVEKGWEKSKLGCWEKSEGMEIGACKSGKREGGSATLEESGGFGKVGRGFSKGGGGESKLERKVSVEQAKDKDTARKESSMA